jgi:hypothetical protein
VGFCQFLPLVPGNEPPYWEDPVPLNVVGPSAVPFGLPPFDVGIRVMPTARCWVRTSGFWAEFASAIVLESANAEANAIVVSFMVVSFVVEIRDNRTIAIKIFFKRGRRCEAACFRGLSAHGAR